MSITISGSGNISGLGTGLITQANMAASSVGQPQLICGTVGNGPAFNVYMGSAQSISGTTFTKLQFNTVIFDTNNCFNTSTYRFTPTVAGYYQLNSYCAVGSTPCRIVNAFVQNGSTYYYGADSGNANVNSTMNSMVMKFNGTTDYVEVFIYLTTGQSTSASGAATTSFSGAMVRSL